MDVLRGSEEEVRGERRHRGFVGGTEEGIHGSASQALDQTANVLVDGREEGNQEQIGQHQVREDTEQDQGAKEWKKSVRGIKGSG